MLQGSQLKICTERLVKIKAVLGESWGEKLEITGQEPGTSDCPHALRWPYGFSPGQERGPQRHLMRTPSTGHGVSNVGFAVNSASYVCFFFVLFLLSYLFLFTFCLARAWLNQPRLHLPQHCCEPVTNETAKSNALNSPVLLQGCQILQWLKRECTDLEFLQLLLWIFKWL